MASGWHVSGACSFLQVLKDSVLRNVTVDRLKAIITGLNDECWTVLSKTGKKQELIKRIIDTLDGWRSASNVEKWNKFRVIWNQVTITGTYNKNLNSAYAQSSSATSTAKSYPLPGTTKSYANPALALNTIPRYDAFSAPRIPPSSLASSSASTAAATRPTIRFRPSPFFNIDQAVSNVVECPESTSQVDRRSQVVTFTLNSEQITKLTATSPKYQLRLYCTSSSYYSLSPSAFRSNTSLCPIEFPPTCEVRVNQVQIAANMKGLKKKPGTAPPADLGKSVRVVQGSQNRVEMVYVNNQTSSNQQPPPPKKYYMVVMLVQVTNVDQLIDRLKKGKYKSSAEVLAKMKQMISNDDDIVAGPQKMSLKCPLSYMRISTPCRALQCVHPQCFDAMSWYSVNEQTTTWVCPVCDKSINHEDIIVDGYFDEILRTTPDSVEDVMVEADGEWHTSDDKYASAGWRSSHQPVAPLSLPPTPEKPVIKRSSSQSPKLPGDTGLVNGKSRAVYDDDAVLVLDSDDEEEGQVKRELSPSWRGESSNLSMDLGFPDSHVIDLTLDSDEEPEPPSASSSKRKASDDVPSPTEQIWKKSRMDESPHTVMRSVNGNVNTFASTSVATGSNIGGSPYNVNGTFYPQRRPSTSDQSHYSPQPYTSPQPYNSPQPYSNSFTPTYPTPYYTPSVPSRPTSSPRHHCYTPPSRHQYPTWPS
ncbi:hypothetical protein EW146_g3890 [Bondarzewia mesenterica]|uniref:SP-RING-type domain-containing protein n=1 Tax=Bondarzewia mesenterica TaxID=1095465 RepID=A0A4S4LXG9_9AGAM|nr:hypothetical protein EW146_g3890 [Bondarzewia mesenterica]